ncbi:hypothetical protein SKAU_G00228730 [Synaphobranchus kaupii]|uniref:Uncharacterized protein n=1 Tax=Synaphobranchus kaupii TaxID=118154 RepID=A0A9Q1F562_SYNKA|nr:hypothetical protein SKAU_G00228730 [Synaphobranchus kaupii]
MTGRWVRQLWRTDGDRSRLLNTLQLVLNSAARITTPSSEIYIYKVLLPMFKAVDGLAPFSLSDLLLNHTPLFLLC